MHAHTHTHTHTLLIDHAGIVRRIFDFFAYLQRFFIASVFIDVNINLMINLITLQCGYFMFYARHNDGLLIEKTSSQQQQQQRRYRKIDDDGE